MGGVGRSCDTDGAGGGGRRGNKFLGRVACEFKSVPVFYGNRLDIGSIQFNSIQNLYFTSLEMSVNNGLKNPCF